MQAGTKALAPGHIVSGNLSGGQCWVKASAQTAEWDGENKIHKLTLEHSSN